MIKNREFRIFLTTQIMIVLAAVWLAVRKVLAAPTLLMAAGGVLVCSNIVYTSYRYVQIQQLTNYLVKLQNGEKSMDIRDNKEGELSILKNEIYRLSIKLNTQAELLQRDKNYLADSLSDISHQLKTPLTSMMMMVDLLEDNHLSEEKRKEFLKNIQVGLERMEWLVQALLKLSKLDASAVSMKPERVEAGMLLYKAASPLFIAMELREITLEIQKLSEPVVLQIDPAWTCEAVTNILKNCMEHTSAGGRITVSYSDNNLYTMIRIKDTGSGIQPEDLPHIFERFYKGKNSKNDSVGIGLALSREIIVRQKGRIEVRSTVGIGTEFEIRFYR